jgi:hypothetical protein
VIIYPLVLQLLSLSFLFIDFLVSTEFQLNGGLRAKRVLLRSGVSKKAIVTVKSFYKRPYLSIQSELTGVKQVTFTAAR